MYYVESNIIMISVFTGLSSQLKKKKHQFIGNSVFYCFVSGNVQIAGSIHMMMNSSSHT